MSYGMLTEDDIIFAPDPFVGLVIKASKNEDLTKPSKEIPGGYADNHTPIEYDQKQLEIGTKVEYEHTPKKKVAREIAMDHLQEHDDYYRGLKEMEEKLEKEEMEKTRKVGAKDKAKRKHKPSLWTKLDPNVWESPSVRTARKIIGLGTSSYLSNELLKDYMNDYQRVQKKQEILNKKNETIKRDSNIIGVPVTATKDDIKKRYHNLVRTYHPDISSAPDSTRKMAEINEAYDRLSALKKAMQVSSVVEGPSGKGVEVKQTKQNGKTVTQVGKTKGQVQQKVKDLQERMAKIHESLNSISESFSSLF